jgi:hypothetical protein
MQCKMRGLDTTRKDMPIDLAQTAIEIEIKAAIQDLVEGGLVFDTGRKRWSERTGCYEIVRALSGLGETRHRDVMVTLRWVNQVDACWSGRLGSIYAGNPFPPSIAEWLFVFNVSFFCVWMKTTGPKPIGSRDLTIPTPGLSGRTRVW